jgi:REP element-mobilizing transposase RayT
MIISYTYRAYPDATTDVVAQEPAEDHYHLLFKATPKTNLVNAVNVIKGVSSRRLRKDPAEDNYHLL